MEGYFKPIQLFHPSNYPDHNNQLNSHSSHNHNHSNHNHTHSNGNAQQASLQQSLHSSQPIQNQMVYVCYLAILLYCFILTFFVLIIVIHRLRLNRGRGLLGISLR